MYMKNIKLIIYSSTVLLYGRCLYIIIQRNEGIVKYLRKILGVSNLTIIYECILYEIHFYISFSVFPNPRCIHTTEN